MTQPSFENKNLIFVKCYGFLSFAENMSKTIGKNITKTFSSKYSQKFLDYTKIDYTNSGLDREILNEDIYLHEKDSKLLLI